MRLISLFLCLLPAFGLMAQKNNVIPIKWTEGRTAMLVRVKLNNHPGKYYMQFDLGSPATFLYKDSLKGHYSVHLHKTRITIKDVPVGQAEGSGDIIGTIGADLITGKVIIFDYPRDRLILADSIPPKYRTGMYPFYFRGGKVLLPAHINGRSTILYFDTGSSAYSLITDSAVAVALATPASTPTSMPVNSWGRQLTAHSFPSLDSVGVAGRTLPIGRVTWISGVSTAQVQQMRQVGIGGMTGNALFLDHVLVLDTRKQEFGILQF